MRSMTAQSQLGKPRPYVLVVVAATLTAVLLIMSHGFTKTLVPAAVEYKEVIVRDGDTLWQIAVRHRGAHSDTRRMVDRIRDINDLSTAVLRPGQVLKVPVE